MDGSERTISCWMEGAKHSRQSPLAHDMKADVCVIGAGIAGLSTAYFLACEGRSVVVLDMAPVGGGQTQRTTAHLSNAIDDRYFHLERTRGLDAARYAAESHTTAINRIEAIVRGESIDCDFTRLDGYLFLAPEHKADLLERERDACHRVGLGGVELLPRLPYAGLSDGPCLRFPHQGQFHPLKYLFGLAVAFGKRGGHIFTHTRVKQVEAGNPARVHTEAGPTVTCSAVVVATNSPINDMLAIHTKQAAYRTYAIAVPVPTPAVPPALYWDTGDPYHYVRLQSEEPTDQAGARTLLIVGGEDHKTGQEEDPEERFRRLETWTRERFSSVGPPAYSWSGQVMETIDGLAFIGRNPGDVPNIYVATGDSGMGMTHGTIAGILLTDLIEQRENVWTSLYDPARKPIGSAGHFLSENLNVAGQYADWLTGSEVSSLDDLAAEDGAVVRSGLRKLAVYRDGQGQLHRMSATCPHLGCVVHWNKVEKSWDCPCHGSRFDCTGKVLAGPAVSDLAAEPTEAVAVAR